MLPELFLNRMKMLLGSEFDAFLAAYDRPRNVGLRLNALKTQTPPELPFSLTPIPWEKGGFYYLPQARPGLHPWHDAGLYYLQEPSAMAPAALLDAQPDERVLDLCSAPGGKTTQLAAAMQGRGLLVCNEINPKRARILSSNLERLGIANALALNEHPAHLAERFGGWFDRILVDAPCSGEGMFRKEEAAVSDWSEQTVVMCAARQAEILSCAARMLRVGGTLVYSTCTFSPEEDEGVVSQFLQTHPDFELLPIDSPYFSCGRPDWISGCNAALDGAVRLWPHKLHGEGHFAAKLRRTDGNEAAAVKPEPSAPLPPQYAAFRDENLPEPPQGKPILFGQRLFLTPQELPQLAGLRVVRPGLELGTALKDRFEPSHALALWLKRATSVADFPARSDEILRYLHGETLSGKDAGWVLVQAGGLSLGWAKGSNGILKNHYPKGLRRF